MIQVPFITEFRVWFKDMTPFASPVRWFSTMLPAVFLARQNQAFDLNSLIKLNHWFWLYNPQKETKRWLLNREQFSNIYPWSGTLQLSEIIPDLVMSYTTLYMKCVWKQMQEVITWPWDTVGTGAKFSYTLHHHKSFPYCGHFLLSFAENGRWKGRLRDGGWVRWATKELKA